MDKNGRSQLNFIRRWWINVFCGVGNRRVENKENYTHCSRVDYPCNLRIQLAHCNYLKSYLGSGRLSNQSEGREKVNIILLLKCNWVKQFHREYKWQMAERSDHGSIFKHLLHSILRDSSTRRETRQPVALLRFPTNPWSHLNLCSRGNTHLRQHKMPFISRIKEFN